jgi:hypothetical protein
VFSKGALLLFREIPLGSSGLVALVDDCDFPAVSGYKWRAKPDRYTFYAIRTEVINGKSTTVRLQRQILKPLPSLVINFVNRNGLDCRRINMRICTQEQNLNYRKRIYKTKSNPISLLSQSTNLVLGESQ